MRCGMKPMKVCRDNPLARCSPNAASTVKQLQADLKSAEVEGSEAVTSCLSACLLLKAYEHLGTLKIAIIPCLLMSVGQLCHSLENSSS